MAHFFDGMGWWFTFTAIVVPFGFMGYLWACAKARENRLRDELERWQFAHIQVSRWLAEFPDADAALECLGDIASGAADYGHVTDVREVMRKSRDTLMSLYNAQLAMEAYNQRKCLELERMGDFDAKAAYVSYLLQSVARFSDRLGVVLTIEQRPLKPLAMGNYESVISVRPARQRSQ